MPRARARGVLSRAAGLWWWRARIACPAGLLLVTAGCLCLNMTQLAVLPYWVSSLANPFPPAYQQQGKKFTKPLKSAPPPIRHSKYMVLNKSCLAYSTATWLILSGGG